MILEKRRKIWVPTNVSIFAWRLLCDRLSTKLNWLHEAYSLQTFHFCATGCGGIETTHRLFLSCRTFGSLWALVRSWIDFSTMDPDRLSDHFVQFTYLVGGLQARRSFLQLV
ncbi:hypothetical protein QL285_035888 [Trifolium repens]|nr:hypothetical protein QL285_035888 [Trifolium repens]